MDCHDNAPGSARAIIISAPASSSGKTLVCLSLIAALRAQGLRVAAAKVGPDYIDPAFHAQASGIPCMNLDPYAMAPARLRALLALVARDVDIILIEGVMGLFDGAADGTGSTADLAALAGLPVILTVDAATQAQSIAALVYGFAHFSRKIRLAGVILNKVASPRHGDLLRRAVAQTQLPVLGALYREPALHVRSRYLGLEQASEHADLPGLIDQCGQICARHCDLEAIVALSAPVSATIPGDIGPAPLPPPGNRIAIACDDAFAFCYRHIRECWHAQGASLHSFSPLADQGPAGDCDAVFLPGGYPELHLPRLSGCREFRRAMIKSRQRGAVIYGECGGYMALGTGMTDKDRAHHEMLGFLPLETDFSQPRRVLGYRCLEPLDGAPFTGTLRGHEFHYARIVCEAGARPLFAARDARGMRLPDMGLQDGLVCGSFAHIIDQAPHA